MPCRNAGLDIDMRIDAALADEAQLRQPYNQRRADRGALADQHQRLDVGKPRRERVGVLDVVVPDRDVVPGELREAGQRAHRVVIIVENGDLHEGLSFISFAPRLRGARPRNTDCETTSRGRPILRRKILIGTADYKCGPNSDIP